MNFLQAIGRFFLVFLLLGQVVVPGHVEAKELAEWQKKALKKRRLELLEYRANRDIPFVFYGRVVDLDGAPVSEAEVSMRLSFTPPTPMLKSKKIVKTTTDLDGRFSFEGTGYLLFLAKISKGGYQYHHKYISKPGFRFKKGEQHAELGQFADQPVIFKVRKKGTPTLVLTGGMTFQWRAELNPTWIVDLINNRWSEPEYIRYKKINFKDWSSDLQVSLTKQDTTYHLLFEGLDAGTGLVMGQPEQYVAPEGGYQPTFDLVIPEDEREMERWLFLEGRGGEFYTMLKVKTNPTEKWLNLGISYGTNPNGSRNLEHSPELEMDYIRKKQNRKPQTE